MVNVNFIVEGGVVRRATDEDLDRIDFWILSCTRQFYHDDLESGYDFSREHIGVFDSYRNAYDALMLFLKDFDEAFTIEGIPSSDSTDSCHWIYAESEYVQNVIVLRGWRFNSLVTDDFYTGIFDNELKDGK